MRREVITTGTELPIVDRAKKYEADIRRLAEILIRSASAASYEDALERAMENLFWYSTGLRAWMIDDKDVSCDDFDEVLEIDPRTVFDKTLEEYRSRSETWRGGFTHTPDTEHLYIDTDSVKYTGHPEPPKGTADGTDAV